MLGFGVVVECLGWIVGGCRVMVVGVGCCFLGGVVLF